MLRYHIPLQKLYMYKGNRCFFSRNLRDMKFCLKSLVFVCVAYINGEAQLGIVINMANKRFIHLEWRFFNPKQDGLFGRSIKWVVGWNHTIELFELLRPHFSCKSIKRDLKWKLTSLSTCRVFEHHPVLYNFAVRWHWSSLVCPQKFAS